MSNRFTELARTLAIYALLLGGGLLFALPFLWMIGTSFKVDREMFGEKIKFWPLRPVPAVTSPYLDTKYFPEPRDPLYTELRPALENILSERGEPPELAPGIYQRLQQTLPSAFWKSPSFANERELNIKISPEMVAEVRRNIERRLTFGALRARSYDLQEIDVTGGQPLSQFWQVTGPAHLADTRDGTVPVSDLVYDFGKERNGEIRLTSVVTLPFPVDRLHRLQLFMRPDDSWHALEFYVEKNGKRYKGMRSEFMGNFQWSIVTLQDYGEDDKSTKIRLWIPLEETGVATASDVGASLATAANQIKVTLVLKQNSPLGAWWAKCQRNYTGALNYIPFWRYVGTSIFLVVLNIIGTVLSCSLVAFSFARLNWPGRNFSFGLMMATMMIPGQVTMIPYFLIIKSLGWYNTLTPLWVISFCGNAFNIFLLRQFMKGIPRDLEDAARIDGCNSMQIYWNVIMPLIKPTLACIAIFTFMGVWNDFMGPLIYLSDQRLYPLSLGLYAFNVQAGGNFGMMMAGSLLMTLPVVAIFFFAQKYFIQGVTLTGMKG